MSTDVLHFSFSLSALTDVFENNEKKNKTTSVYRLREYIACVAGVWKKWSYIRKNGRSRGRHNRCAHYFQAPATQATRNKVWGTSVEIPCWWRVTNHIWIVLLIGWSKISLATRLIRSTTRIWVVTSHQYGISAAVLQTSHASVRYKCIPKFL